MGRYNKQKRMEHIRSCYQDDRIVTFEDVKNWEAWDGVEDVDTSFVSCKTSGDFEVVNKCLFLYFHLDTELTLDSGGPDCNSCDRDHNDVQIPKDSQIRIYPIYEDKDTGAPSRNITFFRLGIGDPHSSPRPNYLISIDKLEGRIADLSDSGEPLATDQRTMSLILSEVKPKVRN